MIKHSARGFTMIEMAIVMVVACIIALAAYPSYASRVLKSKRLDGKGALMQLELSQEKWRANNPGYTEVLGSGGLSLATASSDGYYTLAIQAGSADGVGYIATATGVGNQGQDAENGVSCATLTVSVTAAGTTRTPVECW